MRPTRLNLALGLALVGLVLLYIAFSDTEISTDYKTWIPQRIIGTDEEGRSTTLAERSSSHQPSGDRAAALITQNQTNGLADIMNVLRRLNLTDADIEKIKRNSSLDNGGIASYCQDQQQFMVSVLAQLGHFERDLPYWRKKYGCRTVYQCLLFAMSNATAVSSVSFEHQKSDLETCPVLPPNLVGPIQVWMDTPSMETLGQLYPELASGGHGQPKECRARHRVAIIIPYRDRESHLKKLFHNLHSLLSKQQLDYTIFVIEQVASQTFNRGKLMNVGYREASKLYDWQCFIFHDVDLLPEDDRNIYSCPEQPRHMSVAIDKFGYKLPYWSIFGGISAMTPVHYEKLNGFSNDYWGWGGEDDDVSTRVSLAGLSISRYPTEIARYKMIKHSHDSSNPVNKCRFRLLKLTKKRWQDDGLSNLNYRVVDVQFNHLYTNIKVDLMESDSRKQLKSQHIGHGC